jgi:group I intron endonuclease
MIGIYGIRNKINGKQYVGKSIDIEARWTVHKNLNSKSCSYLYRALKKHGVENFEFIILEEISSDTLNLDKVLKTRESFWIKSLDTIVDHGKGYNMTYGGEGPIFISDITKNKRSDSLKKVIHTKEWNKKISEKHKGNSVPAISLAKKGVNTWAIPLEITNKITGERSVFRTMQNGAIFLKIASRSIKRILQGYYPKKGKERFIYENYQLSLPTNGHKISPEEFDKIKNNK